MAISTDVTNAVTNVIDTAWNITDGTVVPKTEDVVLRNGARKVDATYLYADLADSSNLARIMKKEVTGKVIRAYINAASRILRHYGGEIRSFDGDRVMAIFMGGSKNSNAVRGALAIQWAVSEVIHPKLIETWSDFDKLWKLDHGIGIDTGEALIVRGGVRDHNDLISIGRAPNLAAKLSEIRGKTASIFITKDVYNRCLADRKTSADGKPMWVDAGTTTIGGASVQVYSSTWHWKP